MNITRLVKYVNILFYLKKEDTESFIFAEKQIEVQEASGSYLP